MKLPKIEGFQSDLKIKNHNILNTKFLNNIKVIKHFPLKNLHNYLDTEKKSMSMLNIRKKNYYEEKKIMTNLSYLKSSRENESPIKQKQIKILKKTNNNEHIYMLNSDNVILNSNNRFNDSTYLENRYQTLINNRASLIKNKNEKKKLILPIVSEILKHDELKYEKNNLNQSDVNVINHKIKLKKSDYLKYILSGTNNEEKTQKIHEYNIKFHNSFLSNINWNNNILKRIFKNKNIKINMETIENFKYKNKKELLEKDKEKEKKNPIVFKNINNDNDNSYFNSEINNFYNNCRYKNNKLILSLMKKRNINKNDKRIYLNRFNENIYHNYCASNNIYNNNHKNENKGNNLFAEKSQEKSKNNSINNSLFNLINH